MTLKCDIGLACDLCGECVDTCSSGALSIQEDKLHYDGEKCTYCEVCMDVCDSGAIEVKE